MGNLQVELLLLLRALYISLSNPIVFTVVH